MLHSKTDVWSYSIVQICENMCYIMSNRNTINIVYEIAHFSLFYKKWPAVYTHTQTQSIAQTLHTFGYQGLAISKRVQN